MGKVIMNAAVSLDGYIAFEDDSVGPLFEYYGNGDVTVTFVEDGMQFQVTPPTADHLREIAASTGACVIGRVLFDHTHGWNGEPAAGDHVFVVTHEVPSTWPHLDTAPFTFVTDGVESAIARARRHCGDRNISITAGDVGAQALAAGLVDEVVLNLVPVVLGSGKPFFGAGGVTQPVMLENPRVIEGDRVTHLVFPVRR
jgi:dihydrofolate reductase